MEAEPPEPSPLPLAKALYEIKNWKLNSASV